jgi:predicted ATPase
VHESVCDNRPVAIDEGAQVDLQTKPYLRSITVEKPPGELEYPFSIPAIQSLETLEFDPDVTFFIGENGAGKSTLLEAIAILMGFSAQGGTRNVRMDDASGLSDLHEYMKAKKSFAKPQDSYFLRAESFYNLATYMDSVGYLRGYGGKSLHQQSHGQSFMATLVHKFQGRGLYLLDEPEAALSPNRQLAALVRIYDLVQQQSQFIIATHSPILMAFPKATIYLFDETGMQKVAFEETEHYRITRDFLNNYPRRLSQLFTDSD